jgi:antitoxin component of MazEF toxin-antitoxin module
MQAEVTVRKWGNSLGVVLPKEFVEDTHIKENNHVIISLVKKADLTELFGSLTRTCSGQEFKDLVRKGWEK